MTEHDYEMRAKAADLFEQGYSYCATSTVLGLPMYCVKKWESTFKAVGREVFLQMGKVQRNYDYETKLAAVTDYLDAGLTRQEVMQRHMITSRSNLERWVRAYREGGAEALKPKRKGRPPKNPDAPPRPASREQELEAENRRLRAEVAYLKKLRALEAEKRAPGRSAR